MDPLSLKTLNALRAARRAAVHVTDLGDGSDRVIGEGERVGDRLGEAVAGVLRSGRSGTAEIGGRRLFLNVHLPSPRLVVIGAVHISQALAPMAKVAGFDLTVIDPRTAFASPQRFAGVRLDARWPEEVLAEAPLDAYTALAALTHDPKIDDPALVAALRAGCFYIGALGSRRTHAQRVERLLAAGMAAEAIGRIDAPIGLDIGAASPPEIAVAVLGAIIAALRRRGLGAREEAA